jgi:hypothetical protein
VGYPSGSSVEIMGTEERFVDELVEMDVGPRLLTFVG